MDVIQCPICEEGITSEDTTNYWHIEYFGICTKCFNEARDKLNGTLDKKYKETPNESDTKPYDDYLSRHFHS